MQSSTTLETPPESGGADENAAQMLVAIGLSIREARLQRGMTLQALANATKVSPSMLSLVERGRASPSIGTLILVANALGMTMSDLVTKEPATEHKLVVRASHALGVKTAEHVMRKVMRDDRAQGVSIAVNEYAPGTSNNKKPISHDGFEYGYILEGQLTVEIDGQEHTLSAGDLISYRSTRAHRIWNKSGAPARTFWFNLNRG